MVISYLVGGFISGWWLRKNPSEKYEFVRGDDFSIPKIWKNKVHVPNHQPDMCFVLYNGVIRTRT